MAQKKTKLAPLAGLPGAMDRPWRLILESRPAPAPQCRVVADEGDRVELHIQGRKPWFLVPPLAWIIRPRLAKTLHLDPAGSFIWRLCDGNRKFEVIVDRFAQANGLTFHEGRVAAMQYIHSLMHRGALVVEVPREAGDRRSLQ